MASKTGIRAARLREILGRGAWMTASQVAAELYTELLPEGVIRNAKRAAWNNADPARAAVYAVTESLRRMSRSSRGRRGYQIPHIEVREVHGVKHYRLKPEYRGLTAAEITRLNRREERQDGKRD